MTELFALEVEEAPQLLTARQRTQEAAAALGFDRHDRACLALVVFDLASRACAQGRAVRVSGSVETGAFRIRLEAAADRDPGPLRESWEQAAADPSGLRALVDEVRIESAGDSLAAAVERALPTGDEVPPEATLADPKDRRRSVDALGAPGDELLAALAEVRARRLEVRRLERDLAGSRAALRATSEELAETSRGMVALYSELDAQAEQLRRTSELKSRFLRHVTHELRTPVGATLRLCQLLLDRIDGDLTEEQEQQVHLIRRSSETLADLVNDLLDLAKIEAGKIELDERWIDPAELLANLRGMLRPLVPPGVVLVVDSTYGIPELYTDESKLAQILRNFIANALKFTARGEVRVSVELVPEGSVRFSVADTGIGIAPEDREHIFEEFGQVSAPLPGRLKGTGLGLPLSKSLAGLLGGEITLESTPGKGSVFSVTLPIELPGAPERPTAPFVSSAPDLTAPDRALIIDDDEASRYLLRRIVEPFFDGVAEASGGVDGLRRARAEHPKVILLDLSMPDLDGVEVFQRLKQSETTRDIPVIVVTTRSVEPSERRLLKGAVAVISKFAPQQQLADLVRSAVEQVRLPSASAGEAYHDPGRK